MHPPQLFRNRLLMSLKVQFAGSGSDYGCIEDIFFEPVSQKIRLFQVKNAEGSSTLVKASDIRIATGGALFLECLNQTRQQKNSLADVRDGLPISGNPGQNDSIDSDYPKLKDSFHPEELCRWSEFSSGNVHHKGSFEGTVTGAFISIHPWKLEFFILKLNSWNPFKSVCIQPGWLIRDSKPLLKDQNQDQDASLAGPSFEIPLAQFMLGQLPSAGFYSTLSHRDRNRILSDCDRIERAVELRKIKMLNSFRPHPAMVAHSIKAVANS